MSIPVPSEGGLRLLHSRQEIAATVERLAGELARDYGVGDLVLVGVLKGAFVFLADLVRALPLPAAVDWVRLASYGEGTESSGQVQWLLGPSLELRGRPVVVVEDIVDTGRTAQRLLRELAGHEPASLALCTLLDKPERRQVEVPIRHRGFVVPNQFIVGYGLDYGERYRTLPDLYTLKGR